MSSENSKTPTKRVVTKLEPSGRAQRKQRESQEARRKRFLQLVGGVMAVVIVAVGVLIAVNRDNGSNASDLKEIVAGTEIPASIPVNGFTIGSPDAPLKLTEYGDYQCPYCAQVATEAFPELLTKYIATGQVSITFSPMAFLGRNHDPDESTLAAEAVLAAADQGKFWQMHEIIYANHNGENQGNLTLDRLRLMAEKAGLDLTKFDQDMASGKYTSQVQAYNQAASQAGVTSTPTFVANTGDKFGWSNLAQLEASIDAALAKAQG
jgi:protein-disulfide isomerase